VYTLTGALQEYNGATWADTAAVKVMTTNTGFKASQWLYFEFASPYTYTTTTAGYYRIRFRTSVSLVFAADSGGSNFSYLAVDNRTGAPADTDEVWIGGGESTKTVTVDGTRLIGNTSAIAHSSLSYRKVSGIAVFLHQYGVLDWDTTADSSLTSMGCIFMVGAGTLVRDPAKLRIGSVASPVPHGVTGTLKFDQNGTSGQYGVTSGEYATVSAPSIIMQGSKRSWYSTKYASGAGTAASPFLITAGYTKTATISIASPAVVTASAHGLVEGDALFLTTTGALPTGLDTSTQYFVKYVNADTFQLATSVGGSAIDTSGSQSGVHTVVGSMVVDEEIWISTTNNYNETERRFVKTVNSATSYVLSTTAGGAEAALTYTHTTDAWVLRATRNVLISSTDASKAWGMRSGNLTLGAVDFDWVRMEYFNTTFDTGGLRLYTGAGKSYVGIDNCVFVSPALAVASYIIYEASTGKETQADNIFLDTSTPTVNVQGCIHTNAYNKTWTRWFFLNCNNGSVYCFTYANCTFNNIYTLGASVNQAAGYGGLLINGGLNCTFNNCEVHASRRSGVWQYSASTVNVNFESCVFGTKGLNLNGDLNYYSALPVWDGTFSNCTFGSKTLFVNYAAMVAGSKVKLLNYTDAALPTVYRSKMFVADGVFERTFNPISNSTTNIDLTTTLSNVINLTWDILARNGVAVTISGSLAVDAAYIAAGYTLPKITVSGMGITPQTFTMAAPTAGVYQPFTFTVTQSSGTDGNLLLTFEAQSDTATGHVYIDGLIYSPFITSCRFYGYTFDQTNINRTLNQFNSADKATALAYTGLTIYD
jgi:hypothetical protein